MLPQRLPHGLGEARLADGIVLDERGGARIVQRLLHVALDTVELALDPCGLGTVQAGGHERRRGDRRLDLVDPQLYVIAVGFGLLLVRGHVVGGGLPRRLQGLVSQASFQEVGRFYERRGVIGAIEVSHHLFEIAIERATTRVVHCQGEGRACQHDACRQHRGVRTGTEHSDHGADRDRAHDGDGDRKGTIPEKGCRAHRARHPRSRRGARITPRIPARGA